ncbi:MAG: hypothetical protein IJS07_00640, partial [Bacteroidales bacterium]|nr:hypothetical protein [Bacteroidales bacterium]
MKKYIITLSSIVLALSACGEYNLDNPYKPENGSIKTGTLTAGIPAQPAEGATFELDFYPEVIDFSWDAATFDGTGIAVSKVLIDTCGGDFSSPAASFGVSHPDTLHRALTQDQAKSIFKALSKAKENTLSASWCIASSAGGKTMLSAPRTIVLKMTPDPDPFVPGNPIYIAGTGTTEAGRNMVYLPNFINGWDSRDFNDNNYELAPAGNDSNGPKRMWINAGDNKFDYEIFTHLEAGGKLYFWSGGASLKNADWIFTPAEDGGFRKLVNNHDVVGRGDQLIMAPRQFCDTTFTVAESGEY